jgi:hypothetical protein
MNTLMGRAVKRALAGAALTLALAGCDAAGLLDNVEITATGPKLLAAATEFNGAERINPDASTSALTAGLKTAQTENVACANLSGYVRFKQQAGGIGSNQNLFCAVADKQDIAAVELDGLSTITNISYAVELAEGETVTVTYDSGTDMNDVKDQDLTVNALGLHLTSGEPDAFLGGVATGGLELAYVSRDGQDATYSVAPGSPTGLRVLTAYYHSNVVRGFTEGFTGVQVGGSISVVASDPNSALADALANASSMTFKLDASAPEVTGKRAN